MKAIKIALGAALLTGALTAQQRTEILPFVTNNPALAGSEAHVYGSNFNPNFSVVGMVAYQSGTPFGSGTIESVPLGDARTLEYTDSGYLFKVTPTIAWYWWCVGFGTCDAKAG
ncbi:MAG: hypothetical protein KDE27_14785 [Planctomycetes bacterium]|nr:hypothetical protein [Planctomycetota bacterium]